MNAKPQHAQTVAAGKDANVATKKRANVLSDWIRQTFGEARQNVIPKEEPNIKEIKSMLRNAMAHRENPAARFTLLAYGAGFNSHGNAPLITFTRGDCAIAMYLASSTTIHSLSATEGKESKTRDLVSDGKLTF